MFKGHDNFINWVEGNSINFFFFFFISNCNYIKKRKGAQPLYTGIP